MIRDEKSDLKDKHLVDFGDGITVYEYAQNPSKCLQLNFNKAVTIFSFSFAKSK